LAARFKAAISVVDSTTLQLLASCLHWAKHRRRKAAATCHLRLDLHSHPPRFARIDTARDNEARRAQEVCAGLRDGEIVLFDKAYVDFAHLAQLDQRGVWRVTRAKDNLQCRVVKRRLKKPEGRMLRDDEIVLTATISLGRYPTRLRRVVALVEVDASGARDGVSDQQLCLGRPQRAELHRCRWQIEVFFKRIKQTLPWADFLGHSAHAVRWPVWMALLVYVLLRCQAFLSQWGSSFVRLWAVVRSGLWLKLDLVAWLKS
jgi:hypothetical protein